MQFISKASNSCAHPRNFMNPPIQLEITARRLTLWHGSGAPPSGRSEWDPARAASPLPLAFRGALCNSHSPRFAPTVGLDCEAPTGTPSGSVGASQGDIDRRAFQRAPPPSATGVREAPPKVLIHRGDMATLANCHQCLVAARHAACTWSRRCRARPNVETLQSCKRTACPGFLF